MKSVIVVDDHQDSREAIAWVLHDAGFEVIECENGRAALSRLVGDQTLPDAIVLDLAMPIMSGQEFLRIVRGYLRLARVPVIIVTGVDEPVDRTAPVVAFLTKPFHPDRLLQAMTAATGP